MKAEELRVGDWVRISYAETNLESHKGKVAKVTELKGYPNWDSIKVTTGGLDEYYCERDNEIEPIPFTSKILKKNFSKEPTYKLDVWKIGVGIFYATFHHQEESLPDEDIVFSYVHQIQHFLKHCGIKKEITL